MTNSRLERRLQKARKKVTEENKDNGLISEQLREERETAESIVSYVDTSVEELEYVLEGKSYFIPNITENGQPMTYHDQHYQITRLKNGLPIEAKRMTDYIFDRAKAETTDTTEQLSAAIMEESDAYKQMKQAHDAQHPPEED